MSIISRFDKTIQSLFPLCFRDFIFGRHIPGKYFFDNASYTKLVFTKIDIIAVDNYLTEVCRDRESGPLES
jgi:hypothetical protein